MIFWFHELMTYDPPLSREKNHPTLDYRSLYIYIYLDNPPVQNYRSKSETAIIIAGCLNFRCFQFFSPFQFPHFGFLIFFAVSSGFFAGSLGFFAVSKTGKRMQHEKNAKSVQRQKNMPPAIFPGKAIILHTLEDAGISYKLPSGNSKKIWIAIWKMINNWICLFKWWSSIANC